MVPSVIFFVFYCQSSERSNDIKPKHEVSFTLPQEIIFKVAKTDLFDNYVFSAKLFHMLRIFGIQPRRKAKSLFIVKQFLPKIHIKLSLCS